MAEPKSLMGPMGSDQDEVWLRVSGSDHAVRLRSLNAVLTKGGTVTDARLIEDPDGIWAMRVRLSGGNGESVVHRFGSLLPRPYRDVAQAVNNIYSTMGYRGPITLSTDRDYTAGPESIGPPDGRPATEAG